jgi:hypothetical protein
MASTTQATSISAPARWAGRILSGLLTLFLLMDGVMKLVKPPFVVEGTMRIGYPENVIVGMGAALTISTILYAIPRTAVLGAILLTGYLGGAVASHLRLNEPSCVFAFVFGMLVWLGLYLRDERVRALVPFRK